LEQMNKKVIAIIPARGGSKGFPRKNITDLAGKPLIAWTIEASLKSSHITKTLVSSDDNEILKISKAFGSETLKRPSEFASDTSSSQEVVKHVLSVIDETFDYLVLLQPTSPLRNHIDIDNAFEKLFNRHATALISVCETDNKILKAFKESDKGFIEGVSNNQYPFMRRQDLPKTYMSNGAIYIIKVADFIKNYSFWTDKTLSHVMNKSNSIDIDNKEDLDKASELIRIVNENI